MMILNILKKPLIILSLLLTPLMAEVSDEDKVYILTEYLLKEKYKGMAQELNSLTPASPEYKALSQRKRVLTAEARNEAIATVYGKPKFVDLVYDDSSEMFFGRIISTKGNFVRDVDFYMPRQRARAFKKKVEEGRIEIKHVFDGNKLEFRAIELAYMGVTYPIHTIYPNTFSLRLGGYFVGVQDTEIFTKKNGVGATLNLQDLFEMEKKVSVARINAVYKFSPKHRVEASWYRLSSESSKSNSFTFKDENINIDANAALDLYFNTDIYKLNYVYSAYKTSKLELDFRVGLHITQIETGFDASYNINKVNESFEADSITVMAPLPVFGIGLAYEIVPHLMFNYTVDYFAISYDSTVSGAMSDSIVTLDYQFNRYVGIGGGINRTQMRFNATVDGTEFGLRDDVAGLIGYMIFSY